MSIERLIIYWRSVIKKLFIITLASVGVISVILPVLAMASSTSRGFYSNDPNIKTGMAVSLKTSSSDNRQEVELANRGNKDKYVGITTTKEASSIAIGNNSTNVYVVTSGQAYALATDLNGQIKAGDPLSISPINGVLMKAETGETHVVGIALVDFDPEDAKNQQVSRANGSIIDAKINRLKIETDVRTKALASDKSEPFLLLFGRSLTGKQVSQWQIVAAMIILFIVLVVEGSIIYGATHSTIQAIGRNPLAKKAVYRQYVRVLVTALLILLFGGISIYAILWA